MGRTRFVHPEAAGSPYRNGIAFLEGRYRPIAEARISILDLDFLRSDANQDTVSVWDGSVFRLDDHQRRFERNNARLRLRCLPCIWLAPEDQRRRGLHAHISGIQRVPPETIDSTIKHYHWLDFEMGLLEAYDAGADTVIVVDRNGDVAEGPGFNVFIAEQGRLATPAAGVLDGITRRTVLELCAEMGIACATESIPPARVHAADEVFVTSTAGGLISVTRVDGRPVGAGMPGPVTTRLTDAYWSRRQAGWRATRIDYGGG